MGLRPKENREPPAAVERGGHRPPLTSGGTNPATPSSDPLGSRTARGHISVVRPQAVLI